MNNVNLPQTNMGYTGSIVDQNRDSTSAIKIDGTSGEFVLIDVNKITKVQRLSIVDEEQEEIVRDIEESNYKSVLTPTF